MIDGKLVRSIKHGEVTVVFVKSLTSARKDDLVRIHDFRYGAVLADKRILELRQLLLTVPVTDFSFNPRLEGYEISLPREMSKKVRKTIIRLLIDTELCITESSSSPKKLTA